VECPEADATSHRRRTAGPASPSPFPPRPPAPPSSTSAAATSQSWKPEGGTGGRKKEVGPTRRQAAEEEEGGQAQEGEEEAEEKEGIKKPLSRRIPSLPAPVEGTATGLVYRVMTHEVVRQFMEW